MSSWQGLVHAQDNLQRKDEKDICRVLFIIVFSPKGISRQKADKYEDDECWKNWPNKFASNIALFVVGTPEELNMNTHLISSWNKTR